MYVNVNMYVDMVVAQNCNYIPFLFSYISIVSQAFALSDQNVCAVWYVNVEESVQFNT
jgi:hypothetical protein